MASRPGDAIAGDCIPGTALTFADAINATGDCIFIHDDSGAVVYVNRTTERVYGYTLEEFKQLDPRKLNSGEAPYTYEDAMTMVSQAIATGSCVFPWRAKRRDGELFWVEVALRCTQAGGRKWVIAVVRDISEQHRAEMALRESEDRLARVFNSSSNGMAITALDSGRIIDVNRTWETLSGRTRDRAIGFTAAELGLWADDNDRLACREALFNSGRVRDFEATLNTTSGQRLFQLSAESFTLNAGQAVLWEFRDISDRRQLESRLFQSQKLESVGRLAGGVAHDFNNMLGVILGHVELLMLDCPAADAVQMASLTAVRQAAERSAGLTRQLLAFARQQQVTPKVLDVNDSVSSTLKMLRRLIGEDIELVWKQGRDVWPVLIDPVQVDQILANLCVNARDAINGVGQVTIETSRAAVDEAMAAQHATEPGDYTRLSVTDTGAGISPDALPKVFEPFFTTKPVGQGTGLGLATVHGIVLQNRGFIVVNSRVGQGARFDIYLPRTADRDVADGSPAGEPSIDGRHEHVLVVEDEPSLLAMIGMMLGLMGYTVISATTPTEALRLAHDSSVRIDVVVSDVIMPKMNGRQLLQEIRTVRPGLRCLFVSGYTADILAEHGVTDDNEDFLAKPFTRHMLGSKLRDIVSR